MEQSVIRSGIEYSAPHYVTPLQRQLRLAEPSGHHERIGSSPAGASLNRTIDASLTHVPARYVGTSLH